MNRLKSILLLQLLLLTIVQAGNYKVLYLNSHKISINGKSVKVGDVFTDKDIIKWTEDRQAMKVIDVETNKRYLFVAKLANGTEQTPYDILTRNKHLSTHDDGVDTKNDILKLKMSIANEYDLMDSIELPTDLKVDSLHYFVVTYQYGDTKLAKRLKHKDNNIIIDKSIFFVDGEKLEPRDITLSISYVNGNPEMPVYIKGRIDMKVIPDILE